MTSELMDFVGPTPAGRTVIAAVVLLVFIAEIVALGLAASDPVVSPVWRWVCGIVLGVQLAVLAAAIVVVAVATGVVR